MSKVGNGIFATFLSLLMTILFTWFVAVKFLPELIDRFGWSIIIKMGSFVLAHMVAYSIYISSWIIFIWVIYLVSKSIIGRWSWIVVVITVNISVWGMDKLTSSNLYNTIVLSRGSIEINLMPFLTVDPFAVTPQVPHLYIGSYIFYALLTVGLFALSSWLLDRKVEV
ncbi:hypothetical protein [Tepidibacillus marianensis]|uniref:hypothetical protein n=1 Tax=Tepidibacillus marianensis TaxID=3131995 RepID=UPI0030CEB39F